MSSLVLHDATRDIRTPTHELTVARDVLKTRRRIAAHPPDWALSPDGLRTLRGQARPAPSFRGDGGVENEVDAVRANEAGGRTAMTAAVGSAPSS